MNEYKVTVTFFVQAFSKTEAREDLIDSDPSLNDDIQIEEV